MYTKQSLLAYSVKLKVNPTEIIVGEVFLWTILILREILHKGKKLILSFAKQFLHDLNQSNHVFEETSA